eukprot:5957923-Amphidinium_carterae.2
MAFNRSPQRIAPPSGQIKRHIEDFTFLYYSVLGKGSHAADVQDGAGFPAAYWAIEQGELFPDLI